MSFFRGLLIARAHLAFLGGLGGAMTIIYVLTTNSPDDPQGQEARPGRQQAGAAVARSGHGDRASFPGSLTGDSGDPDRVAAVNFAQALALSEGETTTVRAVGQPLTEEEREWARVAWRYFQNNLQQQTGLVNSVDNYPSTTLWDLGSYATGLISAHRLGLVKDGEFHTRVSTLLASLSQLPLVDGKLPNKAYNTKTLEMVDYNNNATPQGIGWSALDIARIGVPFQALVWNYPKYTDAVRHILRSWQTRYVTRSGELQGAERTPDGKINLVQEGRFGYEQYGARSLSLLGFDVSKAIRYDRNTVFAMVSGQRIMVDARAPEAHGGTHNALLSEPYILEGIEFGLDETTLPLARAVFLAQRNRFATTGILTAVSEDNLDRPPYFVYNSVINGGVPWACFSPDGADASAHRTLSTKAAMGWAYLLEEDYSNHLREAMRGLYDPKRGWYSGRYEEGGALNASITANTNGIILEILNYRMSGPFLSMAGER